MLDSISRWSLEEFFVVISDNTLLFGPLESLEAEYQELINLGIQVLSDNMWFDLYRIIISQSLHTWNEFKLKLPEIITSASKLLEITLKLNRNCAQAFIDSITNRLTLYLNETYLQTSPTVIPVATECEMLESICVDQRLTVKFNLETSRPESNSFEDKRMQFLDNST